MDPHQPTREHNAMTDQLPNIDFEHFSKLDLRVATVTACEAHPNADKLLKVTLDDGTPEGRQVCAGIKAWYDPASLVGRQVVIVANLEPRTLRGEISQGMILAASEVTGEGDEREVRVVSIDGTVAPGSRVS
ncbi:MAG: methionine--tRNA ligase subunit beta [Planctomycetota bacterium]|nr:methionine--tRNA ligase subunit beta [Planctomycetota bacterium]MEC8734442.1 methionine--tRNA ligase subunit beta [Planctomycetota bacterium]MEC8818928.1 methionine--tRNA ligase subunit beta [Planctomycetota bacterium]MEC9157859.1 methionine--tRNA ligase subunit beta [Planctomycetota bacterium]MED5508645.1 methionine--tRNA ligase subunit beta [Planctomycetota bacterium]